MTLAVLAKQRAMTVLATTRKPRQGAALPTWAWTMS
jgi:hypothetical protein